VILPFLFSVPSTLCTMMGSLSSCCPMPRCFQVRKLMKFSVAPLSRRAVCSAITHAVCTGIERLIVFIRLMYILHVRIARSQADGFGLVKNPGQSRDPLCPTSLHCLA